MKEDNSKTSYLITEKGLEIIKKLEDKYIKEIEIIQNIVNYLNTNDYHILKHLYYYYPKSTEKSMITELLKESINGEMIKDFETFKRNILKK